MTTTGAAYLIEPEKDLYESWLAAQREHEEVDGQAEADGLSVEDLEANEGEPDIERLLMSKRIAPGTTPGLTGEWWWVEKVGDGLEYIGRVTVRPVPRVESQPPSDDRKAQLRIAIRPSRRGEGHETDLRQAADPIVRSRGWCISWTSRAFRR